MNQEMFSRRFPRLELRKNVPYSEITTIGVGSALPLLAETGTEAELGSLLGFLKKSGIPFFILGAGSNFIGMDAPYDGVGVRPGKGSFTEYSISGDTLTAGSFCKLPKLARVAAEAGLTGLSPLGGIPGSLGGALRMNAGASGAEIGALVKNIRGVRFDGSTWSSTGSDIQWSYRSTTIPSDVVITTVELQLAPGNAGEELKKLQAELERRRDREPSGRSAGCTFRNVSNFEPAGKLIDEAGLRGFRLGNLEISDKHANFIVADGPGSEADYMQLIRLIRRTVAEKHGFYLRQETCFINPAAPEQIRRFIAPLKINVLFGGNTSEREVSLRSGAAVSDALENCGFEVIRTDLEKCELRPEMFEADAVFPVLHGGFGEGGELQSLLEKNRIRFVGSDSIASDLVMDKLATKKLLDRFGLPTARWKKITPDDRAFPDELNLPLIVKAPREGSSVGIAKVDSRDQWERVLETEFKLSRELLVEEFVSGVEITVPVVNGAALDVIEIRAPHGFYDYDAKYLYKNGHTEYLCPPESIAPEVAENARRLAVAFNRLAGCRDMLRVDFIVGTDQVPYILEGNSLPGFTATSLVPKAARVAGISFERLTSSLVYAALKRRPEIPASELKKDAAPDRRLVIACRALYRLLLLLCAALLCVIAFQAGRSGLPVWPLYVGAGLLLGSEFLFAWLGALIKK